MFERILYATDGSDHARKALEYARELAKLHHAEVVVVHAHTAIPMYVVDALGTPYYDQILAEYDKIGTTILDEAASALEEAGVPVVRELLEGPMAEAILNVAEIRDCDLIILGARGLSDLQGLLLGSVSHKVIQHAHCPVLVVR